MENLGLRKFYKGKRVFVTGHTGFKGAWLCETLLLLGAQVCGYALSPTNPALFEIVELKDRMNSNIGDVRDLENLTKTMKTFRPEILLHLAAQPIVLNSYQNPVYTYETNVMGTVHVLDAARQCECLQSILNVTSDKVYKNNEWPWGYRETDELNGYDPYSNSKSCSELVTDCYRRSFFQEKKLPVSTARAGNVIGGGDFADCRIVPDAYRAAKKRIPLVIRSPYSVRPYQHVLEPVMVYLFLAAKQVENCNVAGSYNVGPDEGNCVTTEQIAKMFCENWGDASYEIHPDASRGHEAGFLRLDSSKLRSTFGWRPVWGTEDTIKRTVKLYRCIANNQEVRQEMDDQITEYIELFERMVEKDGTKISL